MKHEFTRSQVPEAFTLKPMELSTCSCGWAMLGAYVGEPSTLAEPEATHLKAKEPTK